jgi:hypothetical protein
MNASFKLLFLAGCCSCAARSQPITPLVPSETARAAAARQCANTPGERTGPGLAPRDICITVMGAYPELNGCYDRDPNANRWPGHVRIYWQVEPSGTVEFASIAHDSFESDSVASCLLETVERLYFPAAPKPTGASWTFSFGGARS